MTPTMAAIELARIMRMVVAGTEAMLHFTRIITIRQNGTSMSRMMIPFPSDMAVPESSCDGSASRCWPAAAPSTIGSRSNPVVRFTSQRPFHDNYRDFRYQGPGADHPTTPSPASCSGTSPPSRPCGSISDLHRAAGQALRRSRIKAVAGVEAVTSFSAARRRSSALQFLPIRKKGKLPAEAIGQDYEFEYGIDIIEFHEDALSSGDRCCSSTTLSPPAAPLRPPSTPRRLNADVVGAAFVVGRTSAARPGWPTRGQMPRPDDLRGRVRRVFNLDRRIFKLRA